MGLWLTKLFFGGSDPVKILLLGLDGAGKTTLLYKLKLGERVATIPTIGFNVETVDVKGLSFTVWDVGGQEKIRALWRPYFVNTHGLVFMVDSCDRLRIQEACSELHSVLEHDDMRDVPVVVIANKQDLPNAASPSEMIELLKLRDCSPCRQWYLQGACANRGEGVYEAMEQMAKYVKEYKSKH